MDPRKSCAIRSCSSSIPERRHRRRVGAYRASDSSGSSRRVPARHLVSGLMYVPGEGCQWRVIPKDLPARSTVYRYFCDWTRDGTLDRIHCAFYVKCREQLVREASPTACIVDSHPSTSSGRGRQKRRKGRAFHRSARLRRRQGLRRATQAMAREPLHRLVEPLPPTGQGLRNSQPNRPRLPPSRRNPPHAAKTRQSNANLWDGLLLASALWDPPATRSDGVPHPRRDGSKSLKLGWLPPLRRKTGKECGRAS